MLITESWDVEWRKHWVWSLETLILFLAWHGVVNQCVQSLRPFTLSFLISINIRLGWIISSVLSSPKIPLVFNPNQSKHGLPSSIPQGRWDCSFCMMANIQQIFLKTMSIELSNFESILSPKWIDFCPKRIYFFFFVRIFRDTNVQSLQTSFVIREIHTRTTMRYTTYFLGWLKIKKLIINCWLECEAMGTFILCWW